MDGASTEDLVLAYLARWTAAGEDPPALTPREVGTALSGTEPRLSRLLELLSALERLEDRGELRTREAGDGTARFVPTERGIERARAVRDRLADEPVVLADGDREELALGEVADRLGRRLVDVAAAVTDEGVYRPDDTVEREFVDRTGELDALRAELDRVRDGEGRAVAVTGPPGVGKTALADRLLDRAEGVEVLRARVRGEGAVAYGPLREAVAGLAGDPFADRETAGDDAGHHEGVAHPGDAAHSDDPEVVTARRARLFRDLAALLTPDPGDPPRVLFLDDLHLADPGTFAALDHLLADLDDRRLFVLASYRPAELPDEAPAAIREGSNERDEAIREGPDEASGTTRDGPDEDPEGGSDASGDARLTRIDLAPFDREGTRRLVEVALGTRRVPGEFVAAVAERTGGTPLFVEATVEALLETDRLDPDLDVFPGDPEAIDLPDEVRATVERRVGRLPGPARDLLRWAAVLGERFRADALAAVADGPPARTHRYLDSLVEGGLFDRTAEGRLAFRSEVVREAVLEGLADEERRRRHARVAAVLADRSGVDPARIAHHRERAGDPERAVDAHRRAADEALAVYAHRTAIEHCRAALGLAREADDRAALVESALRLSGVYRTIGEYDEAERFAAFARERAATDDERRRALVGLARVATDRGDHDRAVELAEEGLTIGGEDEVAARLLSVRGEAEYAVARYDDCVGTSRRQLALADEAGSDPLSADAHRRLGAIHTRWSETDRARHHLRAAIDARGDDARGVAEAHRELGMIAMGENDVETAAEHYEAALEGFEAVGDRHAIAETHHKVGAAYWEQEAYDRIREHFEAALAEYRDLGDRHRVGRLQGELGALALARGDHERGREYVDASLETLRAVGDRQGVCVTRLNRGTLHLELDEYDRAREDYEAALAAARETGDRHHATRALWGLAEVAVQHGEFERAREHGEAALTTEGVAGIGPDSIEPFRAIVEDAVERGDDELVREWCGRALDALEELPGEDVREAREWTRARLDELDATVE